MSVCRSCRAPIVWAETTQGRRIPLDAEDMGGWKAPTPAPDGNVMATGSRLDPKFGSVMIVQILGPGQAPAGETLYRSHFATCPQADAHRGGR